MADPDVPIDASFVNITQQDIDECTQHFAQGGVKACESFLRRKAEEWKTIPLNIGIIGNAGTGKSSFINAIRGLTADDKEKEAAEVGVTETTMTVKAYPHPNNDLLKFWDLPGVGTLNFPKDGYLEKIGFDKFDFFLIISKDRFTENDLWIANAIIAKEKQFFFVRTHIHDNIKNDKKAYPRTHNKEAVLVKIRNNIRDNLGILYREGGAFLIDNYKHAMYDFNRLEQRIIEDFPSLKREAFILSVSTLSEEMVTKKVQVLRSQIWRTAALSGAIGLIPVPGASIVADSAMILTQSVFYFHQLGLDDKSLHQTAKIMQCDVNRLSDIVAKCKESFLTTQGIKEFIKTVPMVTASMATEEAARFIPFLGSLLAGTISFGTTYAALNRMLDKLEEVALLVMKAAVKGSSDLVD